MNSAVLEICVMTYSVMYDGRVWKEFRVINEKPLLDNPYTFAFSLNVDWFQPFKHVTYSVGEIYLSVLNLPINI